MPIKSSGGAADHGALTGLADDDHLQYLLLVGRTGGQVIGSLAHTGGAQTDIALEGRMLLGDNLSGVNYTLGRALDIRQLARNATAQAAIQYVATGFTGTASGTWRGFQLTLSGTAGYSGGTLNIGQGFFFSNTLTVPSGVSATTLIGGVFQSTPNETSSAVATGIANLFGLQAQALGATAPNTLHVGTKLTGMYTEISNRNKPFTTVYGYELSVNSTLAGAVTDLIMFGVNTAVQWSATAGVTNTYGLKLDMGISAVTNFVNRYGLWVDDWFAKNILAQPTTIGAQQDPIHTCDIQGNLGLTITANKVGAYAPATETVIPCDATAGAFAINLPSAVGIRGRVYIIKKVDATANAVTVTPNGAETIDGAATVVLNAQWQVTRIISNNVNWLII